MDSLTNKTVSVVDNKTEDHRAVKAHLKKSREFRLGCCYRTAEDALKDIARHRPDIVLINVRLPGICGIECTHTFKKILPDLPVIVFSEEACLRNFIRAFHAGAVGFFAWPGTPESLQRIMRNALSGWRPFSKEIQKLLVESLTTASVLDNPNVSLTPTEHKTIAYLTLGLSDKEIARLEGISTATVHSITNRIYRKLDVHSRRDAVGIFLGFKHKTAGTVRP